MGQATSNKPLVVASEVLFFSLDIPLLFSSLVFGLAETFSRDLKKKTKIERRKRKKTTPGGVRGDEWPLRASSTDTL